VLRLPRGLRLAAVPTEPALALFYAMTIYAVATIRPNLVTRSAKRQTPWREKVLELRALRPVAIVILIAFGGIFGGLFSPTEGGAVTCSLVLVLLILLQKRHAIPHIVTVFKDTAKTVTEAHRSPWTSPTRAR
jgi:TRAP-type C4-dicarboxylate transport system permease large subunit